MREIEVWKDIREYEGLYQVSNLGRVKNLNYKNTGKEKIMKGNKQNNGYLNVSLSKNGKKKYFSVHRLVAQAFIPNPENKPQIDHINTIRTDNRVENLRWVTPKENMNNPLTKEKRKGENNPMYGKTHTKEAKQKNSETHKGENNPKSKKVYCGGIIFPSGRICSNFYNVNYGTIKHWLRGNNPIPQKFKELGLRLATEKDLQKYPMYNKNIHGEKSNINACIQKSKAVYCGGIIFETITKCAEYYKIERKNISNWLSGKIKMPKEFQDLGLRYATEEEIQQLSQTAKSLI